MTATYQPAISICIPAYNQTIYLTRLLQSIEIQKFTDFEIIISDDSVTEDVRNLIAEYDFGGKLKYFRNQPSLGSPANWNAAIQKATGKYIKIMHHDDAFTSETSLLDMFNYIEAHDYDYVFCDTQIVNIKDPAQSRIHTIRKLSKIIRKPYLLFFGNRIGAPSTLLLKRQRFPGLEYNTRYIWLVDMEYYIRIFQASDHGKNFPQPLILTHYASEDQVTTRVLADYALQVREQAMLYNFVAPGAPSITRFFMQINIVRLFFKGRVNNKELANYYNHVPRLLSIYFSSLKFKPLYFAYYILIRAMDLLRKGLF